MIPILESSHPWIAYSPSELYSSLNAKIWKEIQQVHSNKRAAKIIIIASSIWLLGGALVVSLAGKAFLAGRAAPVMKGLIFAICMINALFWARVLRTGLDLNKLNKQLSEEGEIAKYGNLHCIEDIRQKCAPWLQGHPIAPNLSQSQKDRLMTRFLAYQTIVKETLDRLKQYPTDWPPSRSSASHIKELLLTPLLNAAVVWHMLQEPEAPFTPSENLMRHWTLNPRTEREHWRLTIPTPSKPENISHLEVDLDLLGLASATQILNALAPCKLSTYLFNTPLCTHRSHPV